MFIEITRINSKGEEKANLVNTESINSVIELTVEPKELYDSEGNLVKVEEPTEKKFMVSLRGGTQLTISEKTYNELKKVLVK